MPLQCEFYALEGLAQLIQTITTVQSGLNRELMLQGIVLTMYDTRNKLSEMVEADVRPILALLFIKPLYLAMSVFLRPRHLASLY